jgi:hypothetical protein
MRKEKMQVKLTNSKTGKDDVCKAKVWYNCNDHLPKNGWQVRNPKIGYDQFGVLDRQKALDSSDSISPEEYERVALQNARQIEHQRMKSWRENIPMEDFEYYKKAYEALENKRDYDSIIPDSTIWLNDDSENGDRYSDEANEYFLGQKEKIKKMLDDLEASGEDISSVHTFYGYLHTIGVLRSRALLAHSWQIEKHQKAKEKAEAEGKEAN